MTDCGLTILISSCTKLSFFVSVHSLLHLAFCTPSSFALPSLDSVSYCPASLCRALHRRIVVTNTPGHGRTTNTATDITLLEHTLNQPQPSLIFPQHRPCRSSTSPTDCHCGYDHSFSCACHGQSVRNATPFSLNSANNKQQNRRRFQVLLAFYDLE